MALLQLSEPGQTSAPHQHKLAAGIDLGTTNSLVASVQSGQARILTDAEGSEIVPSVVRYSQDGIQVGRLAKEHAVIDPLNTISSAKRLIGRQLADIASLGTRLPYEFIEKESSVPRIKTVSGEVSPIEVSAEILKVLALRAEETLGGELTGVVITVPAYFDDAQRQATKDAAKLAKLNVLRLLNEPTAAAVAYGLDTGSDGIHAIYDFGGGTFDISILRLHKGVFEVLSTGGNSSLGGDDFDDVVADWIMQQTSMSTSVSPSLLRQLLLLACKAKHDLTENDIAQIELSGEIEWTGELSLAQFNELIEPLVKKSINACRRVLRDAGIKQEDIKDVVMVGGSTRVLRVRELVGQFFKTDPLISINPDTVVAVGAALQADVLAGNNPDEQMLLLDVNPLSLGIETMGGLVEKIIPRNSTIPLAKAQEFTTYKDGQTAMAIHVLQGERELVTDCRSLARFELRGFPPMVAGGARIRVTLNVDADGLLSVEAEELTSQVKAKIEVKPSYGLSDGEIESMLTDSFEFAEMDMLSRRLREEQVEASRVVSALEGALESDGKQLLSEQERKTIDDVLHELVQMLDSEDVDAIKQTVKKVESVCEFYVERRMNASVSQAMSGHKVDEFE